MALIALCKLNLQTRMCSHPLGLLVWFSVRSFVYFYSLCVRTAKALARMRSLAWAFAVHLCDKYHNLMSWLISYMCTFENVLVSYMLYSWVKALVFLTRSAFSSCISRRFSSSWRFCSVSFSTISSAPRAASTWIQSVPTKILFRI